MIYSSVEFIFFLLFSVCFFSAASGRYKILVLLLSSFFWYSSWSISWLFVLGGIAVFSYGLLFWARSKPGRQSRLFFLSLLVLNLGFFIFLKSTRSWAENHIAPYGISFFMMMLMGLIIDRWRAPQKPLEKMSEWLLMLFFFPLLVGGPIERGRDFLPQLSKLRFDYAQLRDGLLIFFYGFMKRYLLSLPLQAPMELFFGQENFTWSSLVMMGLLGTFRAYIDFSSYCDMGRGAALCFGVKVKINFRPFYYSSSPHDFWQRWNITIGTWMRDYVSLPILLRWGRQISPLLIIFLAFVLIGLWHGLSVNWLVFGMFNGFLVAFYVALQSFFRHSKGALTASGFFLSFILYIGNGLLQHEKIFHFLSVFKNTPSTNSSSFSVDTLLPLVPWIALLLLVEMFQERTGDLDFYLKAPRIVKNIMIVAVAVGYMTVLYYGLVDDYKVELPMYFRF